MKITVPESVLKETTKCEHNFSCLDSGQCDHCQNCEVDYAAGKNILFLHLKEQCSCSYCVSFGSRHICRCPVNYYLFQNKKLNQDNVD